MRTMFQNCYKLEYLDLSNFNIKLMLNFKNKKNCEFITNNKDILKLYNST